MTNYIKEVNEELFRINLEEAWYELCTERTTNATVEVLVGASSGRYAPKEFCEMFSIRGEDGQLMCSDVDSESYNDDILDIFSSMSDEVINIAKDIAYGLNIPYMGLYFGYNDNGDIALMLAIEEDFWSKYDYCPTCNTIYEIYEPCECIPF